jgi:large subunit ribosomal protein L21
MYAVIKTGGKQYRVASGEVIKVERLDGEVGDTLAFDQVLMVGGEDGAAPRIGAPLVAGASVTAEVLEQGKAPKILVFKKKRRKNYRRRRGHRQMQTVLRIRDIAVA